MADTEKGCVICGGEEKDGELLIAAPCGRHWVCPDDISSFFHRATENESLFPPKCCGQMFMLQEYEEYVPFDVAWAYQVKEQGEYVVLAKFRVYCSNPACAKFLHPSTHVTDEATKIMYAICEAEACGKLTCVGCKNPLNEGTQIHVCKKDENEVKFQKLATENGYQKCSQCSAVVELAEACNHITCSCGYDFCYLCGKEWAGLHGCPHYGQAIFDAEGYNQDGYHRDTSLNHAGLTRRQEMARRHGEDPDDDNEDENEEDGDEDDEEWDIMQHLTPDQRIAVNILHGPAREDALDNLRIELFESQGITFGQDPPPPQTLTERQLDIVVVLMQEIHVAHDPLINPLLLRLRNEVLDAQVTEQVFQQIADLYVQHISPDVAQQLVQFIVTLNADQTLNLSLQLAVQLRIEQAIDFVNYLCQQILARRPAGQDGGQDGQDEGVADNAAPSPASLTAQLHQVLIQILDQMDEADSPFTETLINRLVTENLDAVTSTQLLSRAAELFAQQIGPHLTQLPDLAQQLGQNRVQLSAQDITSFKEAVEPGLSDEQATEFLQHFSRHILVMAGQQTEEQGGGGGDAAAAEDEAHMDENAIAWDDLFTDRTSETSVPDLFDPDQDEATGLTPAEATRLHYHQTYHVAADNKYTAFPSTTPEPKNPIDSPALGDKQPEIGLEAGVRGLWGPPGGWPRGDEEEL